MVFSEVLLGLRKSRGLTRQQLADATGISIHTITSYEKGRREPNAKGMAALERYFQVSGEFLRGEADQESYTQEGEALRGKQEDVAALFHSFQSALACGSQENQLTAVAVLAPVIQTLTQNLLYGDSFSGLSASEVSCVFSSMFQLNAQGRAELAKRAEELSQLTQYKK